MTQSLVTSAIPFDRKNARAVNQLLDQLRPKLFDAENELRKVLDGRPIHFMSITVVRGDPGEPTYLVFELSGDGTPDEVFATVGDALQTTIAGIFRTADIETRGTVTDALKAHRIKTGSGLFDTPGLDFCGTPGMSVDRITGEYGLARALRTYFSDNPPDGAPLEVFGRAKAHAASLPQFTALMTPENFPGVARSDGKTLDLSFIASLALKGIVKYFWPALAVLGLLVVAASWGAWSAGGVALGIMALVLSSLVAFLVLVGLVAAAYFSLRKLEADNEPVDTVIDPAVMAEIVDHENLFKDTQQNHLAGISVMQAGWLRGLTLRLAFFVIGEMAARKFRPGYLGELGTIHFARWVRLPKTNKLLFFSNFGGSWESYLEDFITKASTGLTGVWGNTAGFPRTSNLFFKGAEDGDRFKRWARRQQRPTRFWYSAYPHLTTARIRTNAAIRQGLSTVTTEDEAISWLGLFGSRVRPDNLIETFEVQTLLYGGLSKHPHSTCLILVLPGNPAAARALLRQLEPRVTCGDQPPKDKVLILGLTAGGLYRLGLQDGILGQFPSAFRAGMGSPARANLLSDTGEDHARHWLWGGPETSVDAALIVYAKDAETLAQETAQLTAEIVAAGGVIRHQVVPKPLPVAPPGTDVKEVVREPFGFADGISQPIIKGTRRWMRQSDAIHTVEPGEFLLGYPDGRGFFPPSPKVPAERDPKRLLPLADPVHRHETLVPNFETSQADKYRDLGRNGSFLVIRQLAQDVDAFNAYLNETAANYADHPAVPQEVRGGLLPEWIGAKMVGRWKDGSSLVRFPHKPASSYPVASRLGPDNEFLPGAEDPLGERCPFGSHIRRSNPRDSQSPGAATELGIVNRHRILRVGRAFDAQGANDPAHSKPGLLFMCLNVDIERQFEFIQQTWSMAWQFHGLENEVDPIVGRGRTMGRLTIPSPNGPLYLSGIKDWVHVRGGDYFFMPSRSAMRFMAQDPV